MYLSVMLQFKPRTNKFLVLILIVMDVPLGDMNENSPKYESSS